MRLYNHRCLGIIAFLCVITGAKAQKSATSPLTTPSHRELLEYYDQRAVDFVSKNLNRFGLYRLQDYSLALDSMYELEKKDTLDKIEQAYVQTSSARKSLIAKQKIRIKELSDKQKILRSDYNKLLRKAAITFAIWLVIIIVVIQYRKGKLKKADVKLDASNIQLKATEEEAEKGKQLFSELHLIKNKLEDLATSTESLAATCNDGGNAELITLVERLNTQIRHDYGLMQAVMLQETAPGDEKVATDINTLCDEIVEIAYRGVRKTDGTFNCTVTKDFEKKLPEISIVPPAVGSLLLNVLSNAFLAVKEKSEKEIKGYEPKVAISTRILPRFLQIRIRDNGDGMDDNALKQITDEFFSTRPLGKGAGLGMYESNRLITELHKGEIKVESEAGRGTDVYIKFFI